MKSEQLKELCKKALIGLEKHANDQIYWLYSRKLDEHNRYRKLPVIRWFFKPLSIHEFVEKMNSLPDHDFRKAILGSHRLGIKIETNQSIHNIHGILITCEIEQNVELKEKTINQLETLADYVQQHEKINYTL